MYGWSPKTQSMCSYQCVPKTLLMKVPCFLILKLLFWPHFHTKIPAGPSQNQMSWNALSSCPCLPAGMQAMSRYSCSELEGSDRILVYPLFPTWYRQILLVGLQKKSACARHSQSHHRPACCALYNPREGMGLTVWDRAPDGKVPEGSHITISNQSGR